MINWYIEYYEEYFSSHGLHTCFIDDATTRDEAQAVMVGFAKERKIPLELCQLKAIIVLGERSLNPLVLNPQLMDDERIKSHETSAIGFGPVQHSAARDMVRMRSMYKS